MTKLLAHLFGDLATVTVPVPPDGQDQQEVGANVGEERVRQIRHQNVGKVVKSLAGENMEVLFPEQPRPAAGLRYVHLSLEEAFHLKHVEESLEMAIVDPFSVSSSGDSEDDNGEGQGGGVRYDGGSAEDGSTLSQPGLLSDEQAWKYCCLRRPDFPALFAVYSHFRAEGYTVHTGHKYGAHFVLYEGPPDECHSRYCVHVMDAGGGDSWGHMKTMTRLMPDIAKCLLVCGVSYGTAIHQDEANDSGLSAALETSSLGALALAEVTALSFSRSSDSAGAVATTAHSGVGSTGRRSHGERAVLKGKGGGGRGGQGGGETEKRDGKGKRKKKKPREGSDM